jgi:hypothetical protein
MDDMDPESLYDVVADDLDLEAPVLVHALSGFLDAGGARALAVGHLLAAHESRTVASFDIDALYDYRPPAEAGLRLPTTTRRSTTRSSAQRGRDSRGQVPAAPRSRARLAWRTFNAAVVRLSSGSGVRRTIGVAILAGAAHPSCRRHGPLTDAELVSGRPTFVGASEVPGHLAGALELALRDTGHEAMGFAAHIPHYLTQVEFPRAAVALLEEVAVAGDLSFDLADLVEAARSSDHEIDAQVAQNAENVEAVRARGAVRRRRAARSRRCPRRGRPLPSATRRCASRTSARDGRGQARTERRTRPLSPDGPRTADDLRDLGRRASRSCWSRAERCVDGRERQPTRRTRSPRGRRRR